MIQYLTENEMLWMLRDYCASWDLEIKWYDRQQVLKLIDDIMNENPFKVPR